MLKNIKLHKKKNVRDMGLDGRVKEKLLLRGDLFSGLNRKDIEVLKDEYLLDTVIDVRTKEEAEEKPDIIAEGINHIVEPFYEEHAPGLTQESQSQFWKDPESIIPDMVKLYHEMLQDKKLENVRKIIRHIMDHDPKDGSIWFHCTQGKDRTGVIAFVIYLLLDIDDKTIIDDYLYTNVVAHRKANRFYRIVRMIMNKNVAERVRGVFSADESFVMALFDEVYETWGTKENFIRNGLKISKEEQDMFKRKYLIMEE